MTLAADHLLVPAHLLREIEIDAESAAQPCHRQESDHVGFLCRRRPSWAT